MTVQTSLWSLCYCYWYLCSCIYIQKSTSCLLQVFFPFNFPPSFYSCILHLKSHDAWIRDRMRDSLCLCGVKRAGQCPVHLSFPAYSSTRWVYNIFSQSGNWKFVCIQFGMFFYCIVACSVGKVGGIIRRITVFSMLSWFAWMSGLLSCWNAVKNLFCFTITRLSTTQESSQM